MQYTYITYIEEESQVDVCVNVYYTYSSLKMLMRHYLPKVVEKYYDRPWTVVERQASINEKKKTLSRYKQNTYTRRILCILYIYIYTEYAR